MRTLKQRFDLKIEQKPNGCVEWSSNINNRGYGYMAAQNKKRLAHHIAWYLNTGDWPSDLGKIVRHTCDNPPCVRFEHLRLGTQLQNMQDMADRGRARKALGSAASCVTLTEAQALEIYHLDREGNLSPREIADRFGVTRDYVYRIRRGKCWSWLTGVERK